MSHQGSQPSPLPGLSLGATMSLDGRNSSVASATGTIVTSSTVLSVEPKLTPLGLSSLSSAIDHGMPPVDACSMAKPVARNPVARPWCLLKCERPSPLLRWS